MSENPYTPPASEVTLPELPQAAPAPANVLAVGNALSMIFWLASSLTYISKMPDSGNIPRLIGAFIAFVLFSLPFYRGFKAARTPTPENCKSAFLPNVVYTVVMGLLALAIAKNGVVVLILTLFIILAVPFFNIRHARHGKA